jgi:tetratricopeptide (TPR) repeat protein
MGLFGPNIDKLKERRDLPRLREQLKSAQDTVRLQAVKALSDLKDTQGLQEALKNDDAQVRVEAISGFSSMTDPNEPTDDSIVDAFVDALTEDSDAKVRAAAIEAIYKAGIGDEQMWGGLALSFLKDQKYDDACLCFEKAIALKPGDPHLLQGVAAPLLRHGQHEKALPYYEKAIEIDPNDATLWSGKAAALAGCKRVDEAVTCFKQAINLDPNLIEARRGLSSLYYQREEFEALAPLAEETVRLAPHDMHARLMVAEVAAISGRLKEAEAEAIEALKIVQDQESVEAASLCLVHQQLGIISVMRGNREKARAEFTEAVCADRKDTWSRKLLSACLVLDATGGITTGTPLERRKQLLGCAQMRSEEVAWQDSTELLTRRLGL